MNEAPSWTDRPRRAWQKLRDSGGLVWIGVAAGLFLLLSISGWYTCAFQGCPNPEALLAYEPGGAPIILDREGERFATLLPVQREIADIDSLPDWVGQAFIAVEDRRFMDHGGVDLTRVGGAVLANLKAGGVSEGGSTITMQLARNAFPDHLPASQRTFRRKIAEARVALSIEDEFDKDQILGLYLNQIYFGNGATGIAAASRHYFGIPPTEMRPEQAAMMAAMVKAPAYYDPREDTEEALERRNLVLDLMHDAGYLDDAAYGTARESELEVIPRKRARDTGESLPAPWFLRAIQRELERELGSDMYRTQVRVFSTLDPALQAAAEDALYAQLAAVESGRFGTYRGAAYDPSSAPDSAGAPYLQGAVVVLDPRDGDVLALVGGRNHRHSTFDHVLSSRRQVGSSFKPFVYGAALARGIGPSHVLDDSPLSLDIRGAPTYRPSNYDGSFEGPMPAREALRRSRNVPTVRLAQEIGTDAVADFAADAGIEGDIPRTPSMALGTVALSPMELARAYAAFAGLGRAAEPRFIRRVETVDGRLLWESEPDVEDRIDPQVAYLLNDMLRGVVDGGTGAGARSAGFRGTAAGKTGTTQEAADVWFTGYTPDAVGVVWLGFDQPAPILSNATGGGLAAPVWGRMMARGGRSGSDWQRPEGIVSRAYDPATGRPLTSDCAFAANAPSDLFIRGNTESPTCPAWTPPEDTLTQPNFDSLGRALDSLGRPTMSLDSLRALTDSARDRRDTLGRPGRDTLPRPGRDTIRIPSRPDTTRPRADTVRPDTAGRGRPPPDTLRTGRDTVPPDTLNPATRPPGPGRPRVHG